MPARTRARRAAHRRARGARHARGGASSGGEQGETWAYYSTRNRLWLLEQQRGARARAPRGRAHEHARPRCAPLQPARRAVAHAKLAGVRDWSERRMGRGPWPRVKVAFDVACLTQTRAGTARLAIGLRDALRAREATSS